MYNPAVVGGVQAPQEKVKKDQFPDAHCSDCGKKGSILMVQGPMVPDGRVGRFCAYCWPKRYDFWTRNQIPAPMLTKWPK